MRKYNWIFIAAILTGVTATSSASAGTLRTVALTGDAAAGIGNGVSFGVFGGGVLLNDAGQMAFTATVTGTGVDGSNNSGIWSEGGGNGLSLVVREGEEAPGTNGGVFTSNSFGVIFNDAGQTAFLTSATGTGVDGTNDFGIWSEGGGNGLSLVVRTGDEAPGSGGATFSGTSFGSSFDLAGIDNAGQVAFRGRLSGDTLNIGMFSEGSGNGLSLVAGKGEVAPGINGATFDVIFATRSFNDSGEMAFYATFNGNNNDRGVWAGRDSSDLRLVAATGNEAPGTGGAAFAQATRPKINNSGQVATEGIITGPGVDSSNDRGIWSEGGGNGLALVAREGDLAPGADSGRFLNFGRLALNDVGQTAFLAGLTGTEAGRAAGLWLEEGGGLNLIAQRGDIAPGTEQAVFGGFGTLSFPPLINNRGDVVLRTQLTGTTVDQANDQGIWAKESSGDLTLIAREGDAIDVDDGPGIDLRTIEFLIVTDLNNLGQVAFSALFTDNTFGVFVSNAIAVPEPSTIALAILATILGIGRVRNSPLRIT